MDVKYPLSRRELIRRGAFLGLSAAGLASFLAACSKPSEPVAGSSSSSTSSESSSSSSSSSSAPATPATLSMMIWDFQPDQVRKHFDMAEQMYGFKVKDTLIPNVGYAGALQAKILGGEQTDAYYNFKYASQKYYKAGWARSLEGLPGVDQVKADMFPKALDSYVADDGAMIAMPYFMAPHALHYNKRLVSEAGFSGPPATLKEVYDQSKALKSKGVSTPYAAYWTKDFCEEYFSLYLVAEGIRGFDDKGDPVFQDNPQTLDVFEWWNAMFKDGLTSPTMLTDDVPQLLTMIQTGKAAFFTLHTYFLKSIREGKAAESANVDWAPKMPGASGTSLMIGEVYQMSGNTEHANEAFDLLKFLGHKDKNGEYTVFNTWGRTAALMAPYPGFYENADNKAAFAQWGGDLGAAKTLADNSDPVKVRNAPWYASFQPAVGDEVQKMLTGAQSPKDTIKALVDKAAQAKKDAA